MMDGSDDQSLVDGLDHELVGAGSLRTPPGTSSAILSAIDSALGAIDTPRPRDDDEDDAARASSRFPEPGGPPPPPVELPNRPLECWAQKHEPEEPYHCPRVESTAPRVLPHLRALRYRGLARLPPRQAPRAGRRTRRTCRRGGARRRRPPARVRWMGEGTAEQRETWALGGAAADDAMVGPPSAGRRSTRTTRRPSACTRRLRAASAWAAAWPDFYRL